MYNKKIVIRGLLVVSVIGMLCGYAWAAQQSGQTEPNKPAQGDQTGSQQQAGTTGQATTQQQAMPSSRTTPAGQEMTLLKTNELIGKEVKNTQDEKLGVIHDIVLTPDCQQASYAALSYGGVFGVGSKLYAIPWQALHFGPKGEITLSAAKDQFTEAASFPNNDWPSRGDTRWLTTSTASQSPMSSAQSAASESPTARTPSMGPAGQGTMTNREVQMRRVTHLTGMEAKNAENQDLGDIEEFVIDASNGHIVYDIIAFGGVAGIGEKYAAVPANAVRLQPQTHVASLNTTKQTLESVAFSPSEFPNLSSPEYMQRLSKLFPAAPSGSALGYVPAQSPQDQDAADEKAWAPSGPHSRNFNPSTVETVEGTVQSVGSYKPEGAPTGATGGLRLRVQITDGKLVTVYAGPTWYAEKQNFSVMPGDKVTITGSNVKIGWRSVLMASEIQSGSNILRLRSKTGEPLWTRSQAGMRPTAPGQAPTSVGQRPQGQPRS